MNDYELKEYFNKVWIKIPRNQCRSFTYWSFLYDMLIENRIDNNCRIYQEIWQYIMCSNRYNENIKDKLTDKAIAELLDISELQEIIENYENYEKENFNENFSFIN